MVPIARRTLFRERLRFAISVSGVALSVMLVLLLQGMLTGVERQITAYIDHSPADLLVAQRGTRNFLGARSALPADARERTLQVDGVAQAVPVIAQYAVVELGGRKEFSLLVGFDRKFGGGPWRMAEGRQVSGDDEVVADAAVGRARGLRSGGTVDILGKRFRVVGFSSGTSSWMTGSFFTTYDAASELVASRGAPSFLLVRIDRAAQRARVAQAIERALPEVTVTERARVDRNDIALYARVLKGPLGFMVAIAFLVGTTVVGLTIFSATTERAKEYGVLKAIGIGNGRLYLVVFEQALIATVAGSAAGVGLAFAVAQIIPVLNPRFMIAIEAAHVAWLSLAIAAMAALASWVPVRVIARIDPVVAFRRGV